MDFKIGDIVIIKGGQDEWVIFGIDLNNDLYVQFKELRFDQPISPNKVELVNKSTKIREKLDELVEGPF